MVFSAPTRPALRRVWGGKGEWILPYEAGMKNEKLAPYPLRCHSYLKCFRPCAFIEKYPFFFLLFFVEHVINIFGISCNYAIFPWNTLLFSGMENRKSTFAFCTLSTRQKNKNKKPSTRRCLQLFTPSEFHVLQIFYFVIMIKEEPRFLLSLLLSLVGSKILSIKKIFYFLLFMKKARY